MKTPPIEILAGPARFERVKPPPAECAHADPAVPVARLLGCHCAGLERPTPAVMHRYLLGAPPVRGAKESIDWCAYSLLGKSSVWDLLDLIGASQIPVAQLAAHVRALGVTSQPVIRFLNQFVPGRE